MQILALKIYQRSTTKVCPVSLLCCYQYDGSKCALLLDSQAVQDKRLYKIIWYVADTSVGEYCNGHVTVGSRSFVACFALSVHT